MVCNRSFEVPKGYPPLVGWKCARCVQGLQQCPVEYVSPSLPLPRCCHRWPLFRVRVHQMKRRAAEWCFVVLVVALLLGVLWEIFNE